MEAFIQFDFDLIRLFRNIGEYVDKATFMGEMCLPFNTIVKSLGFRVASGCAYMYNG